jgi:hypothetical protein
MAHGITWQNIRWHQPSSWHHLAKHQMASTKQLASGPSMEYPASAVLATAGISGQLASA